MSITHLFSTWTTAAVALLFATGCEAAAPTVSSYAGMCDASAAVGLPGDHFVVASDEDNILRIYQRGVAKIEKTIPLNNLLGPDEADIEGAAQIGDRIYWIGSHGQNKNGKDRPSRNTLFATTISLTGDKSDLQPLAPGPYTGLRSDLFNERFASLGLKEAATKAPEAGGLNIEGLASTPQAELLIGFRSPVFPEGALVMTLRNPDKVRSEKASFGDPIFLQLGGSGIRSLERVGYEYLIVAGPAGSDGPFALYRWAGPPSTTVTLVGPLSLRPEALYASTAGTLEILSDDGDEKIGALDCKDAVPAKQSFRGTSIDLR